ncbi:hypothetical protein C3R30_21835, partial [Mycobacterium tuberculosis]
GAGRGATRGDGRGHDTATAGRAEARGGRRHQHGRERPAQAGGGETGEPGPTAQGTAATPNARLRRAGGAGGGGG